MKRLFATVVVASALAGCGTTVGQSLDSTMGTGLMGSQSTHAHGFGFKFSAGRPMNPFHSMVFRGGSLPSQADLRSQDSPIRDQGQLGSCTAFSMAGGLRQFLENKEANRVAQQQPFGSFINIPVRAAAKFTELSTLQFYYDERVIDGDVDQDAGSTMTTGMTVLSNTGVAPESDWPYDITKFTQKPPAKADKDAGQFKIQAKTALNNLDDIKATVAGGYPVVFGFQVFDNFMNIGSDGKMPMPAQDSQIIGGHAVMVVGYDDAKQVLVIRNSWSSSWGDNGYFYMPYAYVTPDNVSDIWTAK
jgi:C1A family cysteine protease